MPNYIARIKNWIAGETLTAADLNAEFNNAVNSQIPEPASIAQGDILYRGAAQWEKLVAGTAGQILKTGGAAANPSWTSFDPLPIQGAYKNLVITNNATHADHQVDVNVDQIIVQDTSNAIQKLSSVDLTVDLAASGANGLDTGTEAISTWYYVWVIAKADTTQAGLLSVSSATPTMPSGYTYKALVGAIYNEAGGDIRSIRQQDNKVAQVSQTVVTNGSATDLTFVNCSVAIPGTAKKVSGNIYLTGSVSGNEYWTIVTSCTDAASVELGWKKVGGVAAASPTNFYHSYSLIVFIAQTMYYKVYGGSGTVSTYVTITGWEY